jgi:hypothetical protein
MPRQDYVTSWQRHRAAVAHFCSELRAAGVNEHPGPPSVLPVFSYMLAPRRAVLPALGIAPRDLVLRLGGEPVSSKVYHTSGCSHSSLFRAVGYSVISERDHYLQVVAAAPAIPIPWMAGIQPPLDFVTPVGIHGQAAFIEAVKQAVTNHRNSPNTNPEGVQQHGSQQ